MERKLATIEKIKELHPIEGADAIERAVVRGWNLVVKKGEFKVGDFCVYCEIDSLLPEHEEFEFLRPRGFRIKTIKLRGQVSQGIAFPLSVLESVGKLQSVIGDPRWDTLLLLNTPLESGDDTIPIVQGEDVTEALGVTKYEPPIPACLGGTAKGRFPSHSIKTDEERIQNLKEEYDFFKTLRWIVTEKLDGSSMTAYIMNGEFGVASRNLELKENDTNSFWKVARELKLEEKMREYMNRHNMEGITLQGELIGEGIQKNKYRIKGQTARFFRVFDPMKYEFLPYTDTLDAIREMGLESVPVVDPEFTLPENYEDLISYADGRSSLAETAREGVVLVCRNPMDKYQGRLSFKVISNKFILKHGE